MEDNKITIIEGPPPVFEKLPEVWISGIAEGARHSDVLMTRVRAFNGQKLIDRCKNAWGLGESVYLEYRTMEGLTDNVPILAIRKVESEDGDLVHVWVRFFPERVQYDIYVSEDDDEVDDLIDDEVNSASAFDSYLNSLTDEDLTDDIDDGVEDDLTDEDTDQFPF